MPASADAHVYISLHHASFRVSYLTAPALASVYGELVERSALCTLFTRLRIRKQQKRSEDMQSCHCHDAPFHTALSSRWLAVLSAFSPDAKTFPVRAPSRQPSSAAQPAQASAQC